MADLKVLVQEVIDATKLCPEPLQALAFEILLKHQLEMSSGEIVRPGPRKIDTPVEGPARPVISEDTPVEIEEKAADSDEEINTKDLHAKVRKFLQENGLSLKDVNGLYYKEGSEIKPLYDDLRSTGMSESQIRIALLEAFENAIGTGNFEFKGESVRDKCKIHKAYDSPNFTRNFRNNAALFESFESYDPSKPIRLSAAGRTRLAAVLTELARSA
jgi:hypothetical protein